MSSCVFTIDSPLSIRTLADWQVGKSLPDAVTLMTFTGGDPTDEFMDSCIIPLLYLILPDRIHITAFFTMVSHAKLTNRIALVTGGAAGIGRAIAKKYISEGARVVIADINIDAAQQTAKEIGALAVQADVTDKASIDAMFAEVESAVGVVSILVNNAAVFNLSPLTEITDDQYHQVFNVNVYGVLFTMQTAATRMIEAGIRGNIINIASQAGRRGEPLVAVYCASKAAVISLTQSAGLALIKHGINVNGISPGVVDTDMWETVDAQFAKYEELAIGEKKKAVGLAVPYGRMGNVEDLAGAAVFLASEDSDYVVAQTLNVDGGNWMS